MPVTLESRSRRMQVFHLPHEVCCRDRCACAHVAVFVMAENPRTGERARKRVEKQVPSSITFLARERKENLPAALLELAEVEAAIGRGYLRILAQTPDVAAPSETAAVVAAPGQVASPATGQPPTIVEQAHASPAAGPAGRPVAGVPPTTCTAPAPASPSAASPAPAASSTLPGSAVHSDAPAPATQPRGKEA
jgi:hypothetical protein